jgi:predicted enzyme related to lactoylglutathione lyase
MNPAMNYTAKSLSPILPVADMDRAIAFYREVFGFSAVVESTQYTLMTRGTASLHLAKASSEEVLTALQGKVSIYLEVENIAGLWEHVSTFRGRYRMRDLFDRDYDMREFHIADPDGCLVMVGEVIP